MIKTVLLARHMEKIKPPSYVLSGALTHTYIHTHLIPDFKI